MFGASALAKSPALAIFHAVLDPALGRAPTLPARRRLQLAFGCAGRWLRCLRRIALMSGQRLWVPGIAVARTIFDIGALVQKGRRQLAISAPVEIDHVLYLAAGMAIDEQPAPGTGLRAAARILAELRSGGTEAHRDRKAIAQAHAHGAEKAAPGRPAVPLLIVKRANGTLPPAFPIAIPILPRSLLPAQSAKNLLEPVGCGEDLRDWGGDLRRGRGADRLGGPEGVRAEPAAEARKRNAKPRQTCRDKRNK